jgi:hypothetical protein
MSGRFLGVVFLYRLHLQQMAHTSDLAELAEEAGMAQKPLAIFVAKIA